MGTRRGRAPLQALYSRQTARTFAAAAAQPEVSDFEPIPNPSSQSAARPRLSSSSDDLTPSRAQTYLSELLHLSPSQAFSPETSLQALTHKSYRYAHLVRHPSSSRRSARSDSDFGLTNSNSAPADKPSSVSHNARYSFLGRRAIATYLALFVHSHLQSSMKLRDGSVDFLRGKRLEEKLDGLRHATNIGREVGSRWGVGDVMRWDHNEAMPGGSLRIQGLTVEAILGAVFATHGSSAAQRAFYLHVLPHISSQLRDPMLVERALAAGDEVRRETGGGVLLP